MMTAVVVMFGGRVDTPHYLFLSLSLSLFVLLHKKFKLLDFQSKEKQEQLNELIFGRDFKVGTHQKLKLGNLSNL